MHEETRRVFILMKKMISILFIIQLSCPPSFVKASDSDSEDDAHSHSNSSSSRSSTPEPPITSPPASVAPLFPVAASAHHGQKTRVSLKGAASVSAHEDTDSAVSRPSERLNQAGRRSPTDFERATSHIVEGKLKAWLEDALKAMEEKIATQVAIQVETQMQKFREEHLANQRKQLTQRGEESAAQEQAVATALKIGLATLQEKLDNLLPSPQRGRDESADQLVELLTNHENLKHTIDSMMAKQTAQIEADIEKMGAELAAVRVKLNALPKKGDKVLRSRMAEMANRLGEQLADAQEQAAHIERERRSQKKTNTALMGKIDAQRVEHEEWLKKHDKELTRQEAKLFEGGVMERAEIKQGLRNLSQTPDLQMYWRIFYWTMQNFFDAYRGLSTKTVAYDATGRDAAAQSLAVKGASALADYGLELAKGIPFVGGIVGALKGVVSDIYKTIKKNALQDEVNMITTIITTKTESVEGVGIILAKTALMMTERKSQDILKQLPGEEEGGMKGALKALGGSFERWAKKSLKTIKLLPKVELYLPGDPTIKLALADATAMMTGLFTNYEKIIAEGMPALDIQMKAIAEDDFDQLCEQARDKAKKVQLKAKKAEAKAKAESDAKVSAAAAEQKDDDEEEDVDEAAVAGAEEAKKIPMPVAARGYEEVYRRFLNGILIYTPNEGGAAEQLVRQCLLIKDLRPNPLEGVFDLSACGDAGQYLSISTGYRKALIPANTGKLEIWVAPYFMVKAGQGVFGSSRHYKPIMKEWKPATAPVGIFFNWGGHKKMDDCDHLTSESFDEISSKNLSDASDEAHPCSSQQLSFWHSNEMRTNKQCKIFLQKFHVLFLN